MPTETTPLLEVRHLSVNFKTRSVLDDVSFSVARGEIFGLLGPNGSGKSTTFHVLTGVLRPRAGELVFRGTRIDPGERDMRRRMGVVFQAPSVDINLSCRENLLLAARLHRVPRSARDARVRDLLGLADLTDRADDRVKTLSGGMKRRLELARSLVHEPEFLILDEPTVGLDEASFERTWQRLTRLRAERGLTLLLSTHRPEEAARCDRLAVLDGGRVVTVDTPAALQARVSGDVVRLMGPDPEEIAATLAARFPHAVTVEAQGVALVVERGHEWIPRFVEAFPAGRLSAVEMHRPSLADVFLSLTGHALSDAGGLAP
ncbi:ABC transporter ATP-binding protein [Myxococcota bacterium]|nr:ABC transporter ATP-binding protein [Myxococcota bacterium]